MKVKEKVTKHKERNGKFSKSVGFKRKKTNKSKHGGKEFFGKTKPGLPASDTVTDVSDAKRKGMFERLSKKIRGSPTKKQKKAKKFPENINISPNVSSKAAAVQKQGEDKKKRKPKKINKDTENKGGSPVKSTGDVAVNSGLTRKEQRLRKKKRGSKRNKFRTAVTSGIQKATDTVASLAGLTNTQQISKEKNKNFQKLTSSFTKLETDITDSSSPAKKKKKRRHENDKDSDVAAATVAKKAKTEGSSDVGQASLDSGNQKLSKSQKRRLKKKLQKMAASGVKVEANTNAGSTHDDGAESGKKKRKKKKRKNVEGGDGEWNLESFPAKQAPPNVSGETKIGLSENASAGQQQGITTKKKKKKNASDPTAILERSKTLKDRMTEKLDSSRFRFLNEQLYTMTGKDAFQLFQKDPEAFNVYHDGYKNQVAKWPMNPLEVLLKGIRSKPASLVIADFGCGDATLARKVKNTVHSFDLVAMNDKVVACDMSKVPLKSTSVDIAVFCLSLMGTNIIDYIQEAHRVLKNGGTLKIAEVESRFGNVEHFIKEIQKLGFTLLSKDLDQDMFVFFDFEKSGQFHRNQVHKLKLKPCVYKKR